MITSTRNPKIQWIRALQSQARARREAGAFVVEGVRLVEEAFAAERLPELVLYKDDLTPRGRKLVDDYRERGVPCEEVSEAVLKAASDTETPQGILAVLPAQPVILPDAPDLVLVLDQVRDPGNLGTILRTAAAAGVQAVLLSPGTVDVWAPKVVRSGMGAHFRLPVHQATWDEIEAYLARLPARPGRQPRLHVFLADAQGGIPYTQADLTLPLALVIGGEAEGAGQQSQRLVTQRVHIPMPGQAESLNAAVATAVLLFEVLRQRSGQPD